MIDNIQLPCNKSLFEKNGTLHAVKEMSILQSVD